MLSRRLDAFYESVLLYIKHDLFKDTFKNLYSQNAMALTGPHIGVSHKDFKSVTNIDWPVLFIYPLCSFLNVF